MQITISGSVSVSEKLKNHIEEKLNEIVEKYFSTAVIGRVNFTKQGDKIKTSISINEGSKRQVKIKAHDEAHDIFASFDLALKEIAGQLKKYKERLKKYRRDASKSKITEEVLVQNYYLKEEGDDFIDEDFIEDYIEDELEREAKQKDKLNIITEKQISIEALTVKEAIMKMDLGSARVLVFKNKDSGRLNVVYRRRDGNVSWIDAKMS